MVNINIFNKFPEIILNDDYILREQTVADTNDFFNYYSDPEVSKYILSNIPKTVIEARSEIQYWISLYQRRISIYWAIALRENDKMIGAIGYNDWNRYNNRAEISYDLDKNYWNKGITSLAMQKVLEYGFNEMKINRIQASTLKVNTPSWKLLKKFGFNHEGTLVQYRFHNDKFFDIEMYGITADMFKNPSKKSLFKFFK